MGEQDADGPEEPDPPESNPDAAPPPDDAAPDDAAPDDAPESDGSGGPPSSWSRWLAHGLGLLAFAGALAYALWHLSRPYFAGPWTTSLVTLTAVGGLGGLVGLHLCRRRGPLGAFLCLVGASLPWIAIDLQWLFTRDTSFSVARTPEAGLELARVTEYAGWAGAILLAGVFVAGPLVAVGARERFEARGAALGLASAALFVGAMAGTLSVDREPLMALAVAALPLLLLFALAGVAANGPGTFAAGASLGGAALALASVGSAILGRHLRSIVEYGSTSALRVSATRLGTVLGVTGGLLIVFALLALLLRSRQPLRRWIGMLLLPVALLALDVSSILHFEASVMADTRPWSRLEGFELPPSLDRAADPDLPYALRASWVVDASGRAWTRDGTFMLSEGAAVAAAARSLRPPEEPLPERPDGIVIAADQSLGAAQLDALFRGVLEGGVSVVHLLTQGGRPRSRAPFAELVERPLVSCRLELASPEMLAADLYARVREIPGRRDRQRPGSPVGQSPTTFAQLDPVGDLRVLVEVFCPAANRWAETPPDSLFVGARPDAADHRLTHVDVHASDATMQAEIDAHRRRPHSPGIDHPSLVRCALGVSNGDVVPTGRVQVRRRPPEPRPGQFELLPEYRMVPLTIDASGLEGSSEMAAGLSRCIESSVGRWRFPEGWADDALLTLTFRATTDEDEQQGVLDVLRGI